ncbi:hypothetical protein SLEP1_g50790 [Rubroshorea leprosula]|uniref:TPX2 C-terminal domain-containing protein n=1 Tax=Rubroshorea leprosula TaxID=152421 RepID=A0AAV5M3I9_9ROSI|nr:hypothetical protein SLEP1_g50790 [Rubroshorea leprosula]
MGESACLVRSFSHPADASSREAIKGDPIRALTESVSFGRFMSESLAWEKWSAFSHNRYLEEVERFSKPGSVAEKKAFFEAQFKRRAAMRAAALAEEAKTVASDAFPMRATNAIPNYSSSNMASANANFLVVMAEKQDTNVCESEVADSDNANECNPNVETDNLANLKSPAVMEQNLDEVNLTQVENSKHLEKADEESMVLAKPGERMAHKESADNSASPSKKSRTSSSSKPSSNNKASQLPSCLSKPATPLHARNGNDNNVGLSSKKADRESNEKKRRIPNFLHMSVSFAASSDGESRKRSLQMAKDSSTPLRTPTQYLQKAVSQENWVLSNHKRQSNSTSKSSAYGGTSKLQLSPSIPAATRIGNNDACINKKSAGDSNKKKRMISKSLHMSINFASFGNETSKKSLGTPRDLSTTLQTPTKHQLQASVNAEAKHPSKVLHSEDQSCSISSNPTGSKARPFSFRSEERAAKRKEFFQKLEEKLNSKEAEKVQVQTRSKGKVEHHLNTFRQSTDLKTKPIEDHSHGSWSLSNPMKKIPLTRPRSPKLGRKRSPSSSQDARSKPPQRRSINTEISKHATQKVNRTTCSVRGTSLAKNRHENASPNIQL